MRVAARLALVFGALLLVACASTMVPPITAEKAPFEPETDERRLWWDADRFERKLREGGFLYQDPALDSYLEAVARKLLPRPLGVGSTAPRVRVVRDPSRNAFALPNGGLYLHMGMLARMENEAQLAALLGHELTHFTHRHALRETRSARNKQLLAQVVAGILAGAGTAAGGAELGQAIMETGGSMGSLWVMASVSGYSRDLETEADDEGLRLVSVSGYDLGEAPKLFEHLKEDLDEDATEEPYFFATHPRLEERIENYSTLLETRYVEQAASPGAPTNRAQFEKATANLLLENAQLDLLRGRPEIALAAVEKHLSIRPRSARGYFMLGRYHQWLDTPEGEVRAIAAHHKAADLDPALAAPHRELGTLHWSQADEVRARSAFERYLALAPDAADRSIIERYLAELPES
jgi:predicted Zn-dependent protease